MSTPLQPYHTGVVVADVAAAIPHCIEVLQEVPTSC